MKGSFITFEGCEGVGKTTQVDRLKRYLEKSGQPALFLREPGGTGALSFWAKWSLPHLKREA